MTLIYGIWYYFVIVSSMFIFIGFFMWIYAAWYIWRSNVLIRRWELEEKKPEPKGWKWDDSE
jgi:hypothetical protein